MIVNYFFDKIYVKLKKEKWTLFHILFL